MLKNFFKRVIKWSYFGVIVSTILMLWAYYLPQYFPYEVLIKFYYSF